ncbi:aspartate carbamoyltransferase [Methylomonas albis]|uniref:Aspartate carbamoyltransferase n=1 Tax=Methylomonas albis TaxID=1854563 RepID=A0ABR9D498_9GAMM|nr:aspartate carbamoyltransferase [Methylomonas albis]MBD9357626.1 aspartate carbamoyltransferase [Methylomonas albis]
MKHYLLIVLGLLQCLIAVQAIEEAPVTSISPEQLQKVVPFAVQGTLQTFTKTVHGGVQHVVIKLAENASQIKLIQAHLQKRAEQYQAGDYSVTERLHGAEMPGLAQLKMAKTDDIKVKYQALDNGGQIHFSSEYPQFVQALHEWFDAQAQDHGNPEIPGHNRHHSQPAE